MPPWEKTGVPIHFHSSTICGSAAWMIARSFASVLPRQSPSSLILWSINAEADSAGTFFFMCGSILAPVSGALTGGLDAELLCVLGVQSLPAAELHRVAA